MPFDLFSYDFGPEEQTRKDICEAITEGDVATVVHLLNGVETVNFGITFGSDWSLLHHAARSGHENIVQMLLKKGADIHASPFDDYTPLHAAASFGHAAVVELLLAAGADINVKDFYDHTPLSMAASHGYTDVVSFLLSKGADVNIPQLDGSTPLHKASANGHSSIVTMLLDAGADINAKTIVPPPLDDGQEVEDEGEIDPKDLEGEGFTPLHFAAASGQVQIVELLLARGADASIVAKDKYSPCSLAKHFGQAQVVSIFERLEISS